MSEKDRAARTLAIAERAGKVLESRGLQCALIGAAALAAHRYPRSTEDVDLGTATLDLRDAAEALRASGFDPVISEPDADDPLGGVLTLRTPDCDPVQIVNFLNRFAPGRGALGAEAVARAEAVPGTALRVVRLGHLIALKLYAGGPRNRSDVVELLQRNPTADLGELRDICQRHGLERELDPLIAELGL